MEKVNIDVKIESHDNLVYIKIEEKAIWVERSFVLESLGIKE